LALIAVVGWGLLFLSRRSAAEFEEHLRGPVSSLHQRQMELLNERTQREAAVGTLEKLRSDVAALREEQESLKQARNQLQTDLTLLREEQATARNPSGRSGLPVEHLPRRRPGSERLITQALSQHRRP
jgi:hypothetical protein